MKNVLKFSFLSFLVFSLFSGPCFSAESQPESQKSSSEGGVGEKFKEAGHDMKEGFKSAGRGIKRGGKATGRAFKKAGRSIKGAFTEEKK